MRLFWSVVLTGGLLLVGVDVYESQTGTSGDVEMARSRADDGSGMPSEPPPPPPPQ
jgi:hypothetical protein